MHQAETMHLKLEKELDIRNFIASVAHVDNYKTIRKSHNILQKKEAEAKALGVEIDPKLQTEISECHGRLIAERNLRFEMDNTHVPTSTHELV